MYIIVCEVIPRYFQELQKLRKCTYNISLQREEKSPQDPHFIKAKELSAEYFKDIYRARHGGIDL
jgi:hypothetical protein